MVHLIHLGAGTQLDVLTPVPALALTRGGDGSNPVAGDQPPNPPEEPLLTCTTSAKPPSVLCRGKARTLRALSRVRWDVLQVPVHSHRMPAGFLTEPQTPGSSSCKYESVKGKKRAPPRASTLKCWERTVRFFPASVSCAWDNSLCHRHVFARAFLLRKSERLREKLLPGLTFQV